MGKMKNGLILIDKPSGISSAFVVARVKRLLGASKCGHTGTLDPFATGLMVVCLEKATKISSFLLGGEKTYEAEMMLGKETDTQDRTGQITSQCNPELVDQISESDMIKAFECFKGDILQKPPTFSALKHNGVPLYKLARKGKPVEKPARPVTIFELEILEISLPSVFFRVRCSSGTYIRTLCYDIGQKLGCGAHLKELRRTVNCGFNVEDAIKLDDFREVPETERMDFVFEPATALKGMPELIADESLEITIRHGRNLDSVSTEFAADSDGFLKIVNKNNDLMAILRYEDEFGRYGYHCVLI